jgi:hypothetical protein
MHAVHRLFIALLSFPLDRGLPARIFLFSRGHWRLAGPLFSTSLPIIFPLFSFVNLVILVDSLPFLISLPHPTSSPFH